LFGKITGEQTPQVKWMEDKQFKELSSKMDTIIKLLALNTVKGKELKEQVITLYSAGFQAKQISEALGQKHNTVKVILYRYRKEESEESQPPETETEQTKLEEKSSQNER
jgi:DNA-directed RNA polymerase specialized sigma24 family protein